MQQPYTVNKKFCVVNIYFLVRFMSTSVMHSEGAVTEVQIVAVNVLLPFGARIFNAPSHEPVSK